MMIKNKKRFWTKLKAKLTRNFWTHCPHCGHWFGGHEEYGTGVDLLNHAGHREHYRYVCPKCAPLALPPEKVK